MKTGDVVDITESKLEVLKTHNDEKASISLMIDVLMEKQRIAEKRFWNTVFDLYPEIKGFDIHINWKKKLITVWRKREEI